MKQQDLIRAVQLNKHIEGYKHSRDIWERATSLVLVLLKTDQPHNEEAPEQDIDFGLLKQATLKFIEEKIKELQQEFEAI